MATRRRDKRIWYVLGGLFIAVFLFTFLTQSSKKDDNVVDAASLANFDPGFIISDWQMGNYSSMSEADIQAFLNAKGNCRDTRTYLAQQYTSYSYHIRDGHFVCLAEETFGDGVAYGDEAPNGASAAHIIWQAAQDYRINPQVLIVLLQKEQSLITDSWPNNRQYRSATGYGCPDTAPCSEQYYGFKNQVRKAAEMFRTVLDGGWTNYPLGNNYIQFNPNAACGGSVVNIRSLATSALYRYTPYQPNAGAIAAGYGTAECGAYGNRNFYLYFEDWFGGITNVGGWQEMSSPRVMKVVSATLKVNPISNTLYNDQWANVGYKYYFTSKLDIYWSGMREVCLRTEEDEKKKIDRCIIMSRMEDTSENLYDVEKIAEKGMLLKEDTYKYNIQNNQKLQELKVSDYGIIIFTGKMIYNGETYYKTQYDTVNNNEFYIPAKSLKDISYSNFKIPRNLVVIREDGFYDLISGNKCKENNPGYVGRFTTKVDISNKTYYRLENDSQSDTGCVVPAQDTTEVQYVFDNNLTLDNFKNFLYPRDFTFNSDTYLVDIRTGETCDEFVKANTRRHFKTKIDVGNMTYFRDSDNTEQNSYCVVDASKLKEV